LILGFFNISGGEIFIIILVVFIIFGPDKIPEMARWVGKGIGEIKKATSEIKEEIDRETGDVRKAANKIKDDLTKETNDLKDITRSMNKKQMVIRGIHNCNIRCVSTQILMLNNLSNNQDNKGFNKGVNLHVLIPGKQCN